MPTALQFKCQSASLLTNSNGELKISLTNTVHLKKRFSFFKPSNLSLSHSISSQAQIQNSIICARRIKKRRFGSDKSVKFILQSVYFIASKLNILPEPLNLLIREFGGGNGGGNGGGLGFTKDFGWGGFDGRRRNRKLGVLGFVIVSSLSLWLLLGKELDVDVFIGFLVLGLIGFSAIVWKRNVKDWIIGFCSCAFLVVLGQRRENLKNWVKGFRAAGIVRRRRRAM